MKNIITATNYTSQLAEALRQQKQAEAMREQANAPIEIQSYKGVQAPIPWTALLAKGLGVVGSKVKEGRALKRQGELEKFKTEETQRQIANLLAPVAVGEQPGFRPMSNGSQLASALASANAPANVAGMVPTAGAGGMPGAAPNADLAAALGGAGRLSAGGPPGVSMNGPAPGGMPMMPTQAMPPVRPAPMGAPMGAPIAPIQTAAPMAATTRSANSQEMTQRAAEAMASPFDTVKALGVNTLERAQGLEDEERKLGQAVDLERQKNDLDRIEKSKDLSDLIDNLNKSNLPSEDKDKYLSYAFLGVDGLKAVIAADMKNKTSGITGQYINAINNGVILPTTTLAQYVDMTRGTLGGTKTLVPGASLVGANAPPSAFGPTIESTVASLVPGAVITSAARSPDKNAAVNGVPNSLHMTDNARDYRPPPGMTTAQMAASLKAKMPGYDVLDEGTHVHVEPGPQMAGGGGVNVLYKAPDRAPSARSNFLKPVLLKRTVNGKSEEVLGSFDKNTNSYVDLAGNRIDPSGLQLAQNSGSRATTAIIRVMTSAGDATSGIENLSRLPKNSTLGWLSQGRDTPLGALNRAITTQEAQDIRTTFAGLSRALGGLATGGLAVQESVMRSYDALVPQSGQSRLTGLRQTAEMRQQSENAINTLLESPSVSEDQKKLLLGYKNRIAAAIPWTPTDVSNLQNSKNPNATIKDFGTKTLGVSSNPQIQSAANAALKKLGIPY